MWCSAIGKTQSNSILHTYSTRFEKTLILQTITQVCTYINQVGKYSISFVRKGKNKTKNTTENLVMYSSNLVLQANPKDNCIKLHCIWGLEKESLILFMRQKVTHKQKHCLSRQVST